MFKLNWLARKATLAMIVLAAAVGSFAETVKDREGAVREDRTRMEKDPRWIYNDWRRGLEEAKAESKPLLVVLRCVPCLACAGIDASVLTEPLLAPLLNEFVLVRVINANDLDLSLFQFDYDLSFSTIIFNGDGTIYGRYGSWTHQKNARDQTTAGFKRALERALDLHAGYPANRAALKGKQGRPMPVNDPLQLPQLAGKYQRTLDWEGKVVQSCVHCHQIGDAIRASHRGDKKEIPRQWIYPMPAPETIGLTLAPNHIARVKSIQPGSIAAKAGFEINDEIVSIQNQPLISIADFSWVLHHAPEQGTLIARVQRDSSMKSIGIALPEGWRGHSDISRRVGTWPMRAMATGGLLLKDLTDEAREELQIPGDTMALLVEHAGEYGQHAAAKKAGFRKGDVILSIDGNAARMNESRLIGTVLRRHLPGDRLKTSVLRGTEKLELFLPIQ